MNKLAAIVNKLRASEPAWLATKRKAIVGPIVGAIAGVAAHRYGHELTALEAELVAAAVTSIVSWAIPNKPKAAQP